MNPDHALVRRIVTGIGWLAAFAATPAVFAFAVTESGEGDAGTTFVAAAAGGAGVIAAGIIIQGVIAIIKGGINYITAGRRKTHRPDGDSKRD